MHNTDQIIQLSNPDAFQLLIDKIMPMIDKMPEVKIIGDQ